ncbi:MAG TPA: class I SAM-dependent methyltransferase [Trebonia sp.]
MTTLPTEPEGAPEAGTGGYDRAQASHLQRQVAEGSGADAGRYDRARPTYPAGLVDRIIAASPGRDVLDVGCGTGIAARLFQAAGCRVLGVDPDPRMAELARQAGRRAGGMAVLLGAALHPGRLAGPGPHHRGLHPAPRGHPAGAP